MTPTDTPPSGEAGVDLVLRGRVLTDDDILHYRRMIVALARTAELMPRVDAVVEEHGGWPGAFRGMTDEVGTKAAG